MKRGAGGNGGTGRDRDSNASGVPSNQGMSDNA